MIDVKDLKKTYGVHTAVGGINFSVGDGEILGFLGPNGAGKTTTMNMMTGYIAPSEGDITINGFNMLDDPENARRQIGYLPDTPPVYGDMRVDEYLDFVADIKKVKKSDKKEAIAKVKELTCITDMSRRLIRNLSKGYRQRVGLAQALLGDPKVLVFDEPTVGLDPQQIIEMRSLIKGLGREHTVILSSHILSEVSAVCDRVMIMNKGRIVAEGAPETLSKGLMGGGRGLVRVKGAREDVEAAAAAALLDPPEFLESVEHGACDASFGGREGEDVREAVFNCMARAELPILLMKPMDMTLEEIFLQITTADEEEAAPEAETLEEDTLKEGVSQEDTMKEDGEEGGDVDDSDN